MAEHSYSTQVSCHLLRGRGSLPDEVSHVLKVLADAVGCLDNERGTFRWKDFVGGLGEKDEPALKVLRVQP